MHIKDVKYQNQTNLNIWEVFKRRADMFLQRMLGIGEQRLSSRDNGNTKDTSTQHKEETVEISRPENDGVGLRKLDIHRTD